MPDNKLKLNMGVVIGIIILIVIGVTIYNYNQLPTESNSIVENSNSDESVKIVGPKIAVTPESFDLKTVVYGDVAKHTFAVKNLGSEPLEILRLSTSCGCTTAEIAQQDKIIAPGQSVEMLVTFDPAVHSIEEADFGSVERIVYIKTNDPTSSEVEVEINANVIKSN